MTKISIFTKILICDKNSNFWPKFQWWSKISIFGPNFNISTKFQFLTKCCIFDQKFVFDLNFYFCRKCRFFPKILICDKNSNFWPKFRSLTKISNFWHKFRFLTKISLFDQNFRFPKKNHVVQIFAPVLKKTKNVYFFKNSADGWYKLLSKEEGEAFHIPIEYSKEKDEEIQQKMNEVKNIEDMKKTKISKKSSSIDSGACLDQGYKNNAF